MTSYFPAFHCSVKIKCYKDLYLDMTSTITLSLLGMKLHSFITPLSASNSAKFYKDFAITIKNHQALNDMQNAGTQGFQRMYRSVLTTLLINFPHLLQFQLVEPQA